ncbi:CHAP domain-containing protein [Nocardioides nematodiphilus]|uniref:CHAP domain-containing protein n=1 Tax=Nocardioides nematodiphilus TaxID=2849669 RepID=UPI001CD9CB07|nr:CHAP domain-containing protein [Nocardioides nematodiphilus]MCA1983623.1 CHAP domain-containing protein [Nocardioides nematodiphilus]
MHHPPQPSHRPLQRLLLAVVATFAAVLTTLAPTAYAPAEAATVGVLCSGFDDCNGAGMSASGYHAVWDTMFWNMYSGRNCTNYVAYRMIRAGMSSTRPAQLLPGQGNASYWGASFGSLTNRTPTVGAVAWWNKNVPGAGSGGHVAYVEKVYSATDIVISESNWSGDFDWRRITTAANWPSGFIHLRDSGTPPPVVTPTPPPTPSVPPVVAPVNTAAPTITGTLAVGSTVTATPGTWSQANLTYAYQWYADGVALGGGTESTFALTKSHLGKRLSVKVTATNSAGSKVATSATSAAVVAGTIGVTAPPQITGDPRIDAVVTAVPPVTTKALTTRQVQWFADDQPIPGATTWSLTLGPEVVARTLSVQVHGSRPAFKDVTVASGPVGPVQAPPLTVTAPGTIAGRPYVGQVLTLTPPVTEPVAAPTGYGWLRDGVPIPGAATASYTLTAADVGHHVTARVGLNATGYFPLEPVTALAPVVQLVPVRVGFHAAPSRRAATVRVNVRSLGVAMATGRVTVTVGGRTVTAKVRGERLLLRVAGVPAGRRKLTIRYEGPARYQAVVEKAHLRIRR